MWDAVGSNVPGFTFQLQLSLARPANCARVGKHRSAADSGPTSCSASEVAKTEWRTCVSLRSDRNTYAKSPSVNRRQQLDRLSSRTSNTGAKSRGVFLHLHTKQTGELPRVGGRQAVSARASGICDDGYPRGNDWRTADEPNCQFQSHCGWIEL